MAGENVTKTDTRHRTNTGGFQIGYDVQHITYDGACQQRVFPGGCFRCGPSNTGLGHEQAETICIESARSLPAMPGPRRGKVGAIPCLPSCLFTLRHALRDKESCLR